MSDAHAKADDLSLDTLLGEGVEAQRLERRAALGLVLVPFKELVAGNGSHSETMAKIAKLRFLAENLDNAVVVLPSNSTELAVRNSTPTATFEEQQPTPAPSAEPVPLNPLTAGFEQLRSQNNGVATRLMDLFRQVNAHPQRNLAMSALRLMASNDDAWQLAGTVEIPVLQAVVNQQHRITLLEQSTRKEADLRQALTDLVASAKPLDEPCQKAVAAFNTSWENTPDDQACKAFSAKLEGLRTTLAAKVQAAEQTLRVVHPTPLSANSGRGRGGNPATP